MFDFPFTGGPRAGEPCPAPPARRAATFHEKTSQVNPGRPVITENPVRILNALLGGTDRATSKVRSTCVFLIANRRVYRGVRSQKESGLRPVEFWFQDPQG